MGSKWNYAILCWLLTYFQHRHAVSLFCLSRLKGDTPERATKWGILPMEQDPEVIPGTKLHGQSHFHVADTSGVTIPWFSWWFLPRFRAVSAQTWKQSADVRLEGRADPLATGKLCSSASHEHLCRDTQIGETEHRSVRHRYLVPSQVIWDTHVGSSGLVVHYQKIHAVLEQVTGGFLGKNALGDTRHLCLYKGTECLTSNQIPHCGSPPFPAYKIIVGMLCP